MAREPPRLGRARSHPSSPGPSLGGSHPVPPRGLGADALSSPSCPAPPVGVVSKAPSRGAPQLLPHPSVPPGTGDTLYWSLSREGVPGPTDDKGIRPRLPS